MLTAACAPPAVSTPAQIPSVVVAPPRTLNTYRFELGPKVATIGVTYPYDLYWECSDGMYARFSGRGWITDRAPADPDPSPVGNGAMAQTGYIAGWMTLLDDSTAIFTFSGSSTPFVYRETNMTWPVCA
jgi:hypothetical protein